MPRSGKIQVFIANDQILLREGLATVLSRQNHIEVVAQAATLPQVSEQFRRSRPHVLLIDLRLEGIDTIEMIRSITSEFPATAVLVVSAFDGSEDVHRALRAGARGYVLKDVSDSELIEAIQNVDSRRRHISREIAARLKQRMYRSTLTKREMEVMVLLVRGKSNKEVAAHLKVTEETVKFHVDSILNKLGVSNRTEAATAALLRGIIHPQDL